MREHCIILALLQNVAINFNKKDTHMKFKHIMLGSILALSMTSIANANIIVIDDFSVNQGPITIGGTNATTTNNPEFNSVLGNMLGGERDLQLFNINDPDDNGATIKVFNDGFIMSTGLGTEAQFTIQWDGIDGTYDANGDYVSGGEMIDIDGLADINGNGIHFSDGELISFVTYVMAADLDAFFDVTFWSIGGNSLGETQVLPIPGVLSPGRDAFFLSTLFTDTDFSNIGAIQVRGNVSPTPGGNVIANYDLKLGSVTAVSEPGTLAVLLSGMFGLLMARRRA